MLKKEKQINIDYRETFAPEYGKRVLANLTRTTGALKANPPTDALTMAYKEGQRSVIIHIYAMLNKQINEPKQERAIND
jgi:hypothetical protein